MILVFLNNLITKNNIFEIKRISNQIPIFLHRTTSSYSWTLNRNFFCARLYAIALTTTLDHFPAISMVTTVRTLFNPWPNLLPLATGTHVTVSCSHVLVRAATGTDTCPVSCSHVLMHIFFFLVCRDVVRSHPCI